MASLKDIIDFIDEENLCCLLDSYWYQFNLSYIEYLQQEVDSIVLKNSDEHVIDFNEDLFNKRNASECLINCDKICETIDKKYKVEKKDLFKDNSLYFVKFGTPQKFYYVMDLFINTIRLLQNNQSIIKIEDKVIKPENIWLRFVLNRKSKFIKLSHINTLIFHVKLLELKRLARNAGYIPRIIILYKAENQVQINILSDN